jgi:hypothetical protein
MTAVHPTLHGCDWTPDLSATPRTEIRSPSRDVDSRRASAEPVRERAGFPDRAS